MAEMVGSALVQEAVSGSVSLVLGNREERASKRHRVERLEMAHTELEFALERSSNLPITDVPLMCQRRMLKRAYEECGDVLHRCKLRILEDQEEIIEQVSLPRKVIHAVKSSVSSFFIPRKYYELSCSDLGRFEWFADKAGKFLRDVESGCSLAHYRFCSPLIRQLLEGKCFGCKTVQRSQTRVLAIVPARSEEHGVVPMLLFFSRDKIPMKSFTLVLVLRLSESTDIVGITIKCLQSLGPQFKSFAQVATGELAQVPTQDVSHYSAIVRYQLRRENSFARFYRPDPLCCKANGHRPYANNIVSSELSYRFPEQVIWMHFQCYISAFEYNLESSANQAHINIVKDWSPLNLSACLAPHFPCESLQESYALERIGGRKERTKFSLLHQTEEMVLTVGGQKERMKCSLNQTEEMVLTNAINCFIRQPELTHYEISWDSAHGHAYFTVEKPSIDGKCLQNQQQVQ